MNWKFRRQVSYRKQEPISCNVKRKSGKKPQAKAPSTKRAGINHLRPQFGYSSEHLLDAQSSKAKQIVHLESQTFRHFRLPRSCKTLVVAQMINSINTYCIAVLLNLLSHILSARQSVNKAQAMSTSECGTCYNPIVSLQSCLHRYCFPVIFLTAKRDTSIDRITANIPSSSQQPTSILYINVPHVQEQPLELNIQCQCCFLGFSLLSELLERGRNISD